MADTPPTTTTVPQQESTTVANTNKCAKCKAEFGFTVWSRVCTACNRLFCSSCCRKYLLFVGSPHADPTLVCDLCFRSRNAVDFTRSYDESGPSTDLHSPTLVLIHGALGSRASMRFAERYFAAAGIHVLNTDLPGHGGLHGQPLTMDSAVDCIRQLIQEHAHGAKAFVFGFSLGGYVAMRFVAAHPALLRGVVVGGAMNECFGSVVAGMYGGMGLVYKVLSENMLWQLVPRTFSHVPRKELDEAILSSGLDYDLWPQCAAAMLEPQENTYFNALAGFPGHILLLVGSKDQRLSADKFIRAIGDRGKLVIIEGATHFVLVEPNFRDQAFAAVKDFVFSAFQPLVMP